MSADPVDGTAEDNEWKDVFHFPYGEEGGLLNFCADGGKTGYLTSSIGRETTALLKVDLERGETLEELYSNDKCNVGGVTLEKDTKELRALTYNYARTVSVFEYLLRVKSLCHTVSRIELTSHKTVPCNNIFYLYRPGTCVFRQGARERLRFSQVRGAKSQHRNWSSQPIPRRVQMGRFVPSIRRPHVVRNLRQVRADYHPALCVQTQIVALQVFANGGCVSSCR